MEKLLKCNEGGSGAIWEKIVIVLVLLAALFLSGCNATAAYSGAKTLNDASFEGALLRVCSPIATTAAMRRLDAEGLAARQLLCENLAVSQNN